MGRKAKKSGSGTGMLVLGIVDLVNARAVCTPSFWRHSDF
ncbi:hypothetical protein P3T25_004737 [Paraburkholderia sp. GAS32]